MSSTSSLNRTMNPHDKYLNPRPVPHPKLPRLNTSPVIRLDDRSAVSSATISPWSGLPSAVTQQTSQPSSASGLRKFRLPRKASVDGASRSVSPQSRMGGLRAKFGSFKSSRADSPEDLLRGRPQEPEMELNISGPIMQHRSADNRSLRSISSTSSPATSRQVSPHPNAEMEAPGIKGSYFAFRPQLEQGTDNDETFSTASFQQHRRRRSRSKEPSHLRRSLGISKEGDAPEPTLIVTTAPYQPLETLREVASAQNTPTWPVTARRISAELVLSPRLDETDLEKRLPTLPNTPSSAYPPSIYSDSPAKQLEEQLGTLQSHFSVSTIDSALVSHEEPCPGMVSHFSTWTTSTSTSSRGSDYSGAYSDHDAESVGSNRMSSFSALGSPYENKSVDTLTPLGPPRQSHVQLASATSYSTFSSTLSTSPSSPASESFEFEQISLDASVGSGKPQNVQAYRLPDLSTNSNGPLTCVKTSPQEPSINGLDFASPFKSEFEVPPVAIGPTKHNRLDSTFSHSESMQQLLQELSYLGDMIQK